MIGFDCNMRVDVELITEDYVIPTTLFLGDIKLNRFDLTLDQDGGVLTITNGSHSYILPLHPSDIKKHLIPWLKLHGFKFSSTTVTSQAVDEKDEEWINDEDRVNPMEGVDESFYLEGRDGKFDPRNLTFGKVFVHVKEYDACVWREQDGKSVIIRHEIPFKNTLDRFPRIIRGELPEHLCYRNTIEIWSKDKKNYLIRFKSEIERDAFFWHASVPRHLITFQEEANDDPACISFGSEFEGWD